MNRKKLTALVIAVTFLTACIGLYLFFAHSVSEVHNESFTQSQNQSEQQGENPELKDPVIRNFTKFTLKLFNEIHKNNTVFSPLSIWIALAMAYEGARGNTAKEIRDVLGYPENISVLHDKILYILNNFRGNESFNLTIANSLWPSENYQINQSYISLIKEYYHAYVEKLNYENPEKASEIINSWIANKTSGKIENLISPELLDPIYTVLVFVNAIYFKAEWLNKFDPNMTYNGSFSTPNGIVNVPMMLTSDVFEYGEDNEAQILKMPYKGSNISMLVILPKSEKGFTITLDKLEKWRNMLKKEYGEVHFPKCEIENKYSLKKALMNLGINDAFSPTKADFSGISSGVYINFLVHGAYIKVTENGTEAGGATAGGMASCMPEFVFKANHPFIFIIQDDLTKTILFMGQVVNPAIYA